MKEKFDIVRRLNELQRVYALFIELEDGDIDYYSDWIDAERAKIINHVEKLETEKRRLSWLINLVAGIVAGYIFAFLFL